MKFLLRTRKNCTKGSAATTRGDSSGLRRQAAQSAESPGPAASRGAWGILHRALVFTAGVTTVGLVVTWLAAVQVGACQRLASRGLLASEQLGAMLLGERPGAGQEARGPADPVADIQYSSHTLERRITGVTGRLLTPESSAAMTEVRASWRQVEEVLGESGTILPAPAEKRGRLIERVQRLAAGWLRLAASLTGSLWSAHRLPAYVAILACLLMVLVSFSASIESKLRARGVASMLEGMVEQVRRGQLLDGGGETGSEGARGPRDAVGGLARTFCLLIRVLRGQYQAMMKLLDLLSPGVAVLTGDQRIVAVNESFCRLAGRPRDSILGRQLHQILPSTAAAHGASPPDSAAPVESEGSGRTYRSHLARVLPGEGDDGVLVLLLEDSQEPVSHQSSFQEFQRLYAEVLESVSDALVLVDRNGTVTDINRLAEDLLGYSRGELAGTGLQALQYTAEDANEMRLDCYFTSSEWNLENTVLKTRMVRKDRTLFSAELKFRQLGTGGSGGYLVNVRDATQDELAELLTRDRLQVIELIARSQPLELVLSHVTSLLEHQVSGSCCAVMLRRGEHLVPVAAPRVPAAFRQCLKNMSIEAAVGAQAGAFFEGKTVTVPEIASQPGWENLRDAALEHGIRSSVSSPIFTSEGRLAGMIAVYSPRAIEPQPAQLDLLQLASRLASVCIEQSELNSQLAYRAHHDALTGLLNRPSFEERLKHAIAQAGRHKRLLSILSLDLDRFKVVNDTLGHAAGDDLIRQLANRLVVSLRETDIVARWGGDEFVIGLLDIRDREGAQLVAEKLLETIKAPFQWRTAASALA